MKKILLIFVLIGLCITVYGQSKSLKAITAYDVSAEPDSILGEFSVKYKNVGFEIQFTGGADTTIVYSLQSWDGGKTFADTIRTDSITTATLSKPVTLFEVSGDRMTFRVLVTDTSLATGSLSIPVVMKP